MEIIAAVLGSLVAVFIGAYINNVFTWKIKDKIHAVDKLYSYLWQLDKIFLDYCSKKMTLTKKKMNIVICYDSF